MLAGGQSASILMYHRVQDPPRWADGLAIKTFSATPQQFEKHLQLLRDRFEVLSLEQYVDQLGEPRKANSNSVIITFDDGYRDNFLYAFPLLKKYQLPATIFLTTGLVGSDRLPWWERVKWHISQARVSQIQMPGMNVLPLNKPREKHSAIYSIMRTLKLARSDQIPSMVDDLIRGLGRDPTDEPHERLFLSWEEVRQMHQHDIGFGAHSVSHPNLTQLDADEVMRELSDSKLAIETNLGKPVHAFAYPFGEQDHFNDRIKAAVKMASFKCAVTALYGHHDQNGDIYALRRIPVFSAQNCAVLYMKLSGLLKGLSKFA
jgi:peptidoglycan/xylan/chitin deacetylase (PgdA/CDA1 family)